MKQRIVKGEDGGLYIETEGNPDAVKPGKTTTEALGAIVGMVAAVDDASGRRFLGICRVDIDREYRERRGCLALQRRRSSPRSEIFHFRVPVTPALPYISFPSSRSEVHSGEFAGRERNSRQ